MKTARKKKKDDDISHADRDKLEFKNERHVCKATYTDLDATVIIVAETPPKRQGIEMMH
ncbi:hypothetical protein DPMN_052235 [Dreissena polymorpha]|uniref:Uncharacterized protein n=1 Tax=Dreissena polymorpha TaxID=45954 RepID=A0A9D4HR28_DREPO|nr:hypothetical protein DPMN_052235 [Dreissena polymorpha]